MKEKDQADSQRPPSEFAGFVRRIGIDAVDRFATKKVSSGKSASATGGPLHKLATLWLDMDPRDKARFFDQVIAAGQAAAAAAPAMIAMAKTRKARKASGEESLAESPAAEEKTVGKKEKKAKKAKAGADGKSDDKKKKKEDKGKEKKERKGTRKKQTDE